MTYLTYNEYLDYGGALDETIFDDLGFRASSIVDRYTFNRFRNDTEFPEELKRLIYRLVSLINVSDSLLGVSAEALGNSSGSVASQSNDGVSISYNTMSANELYKLTGGTGGTAISDCIKNYLSGVRNQAGQLVLYKGLYDNE